MDNFSPVWSPIELGWNFSQIKFPEIAMPLRSIIAGTDNTPSIASIIYILGIDIIRRRVSVFV